MLGVYKNSRIFAPQLRNKPPQEQNKGQIPEWPNGADCKSAGLRLRWFESIFAHKNCGSSSVDRALAFQAEGRGFEPRLPLSKENPRNWILFFLYFRPPKLSLHHETETGSTAIIKNIIKAGQHNNLRDSIFKHII